MRLSRYIAHGGFCSRRKAADFVKTGHVTVNDKTCSEPWYVVQPTDIVKVDGKSVHEENKVYILLNKPAGYLSTLADQRGRATVLELIRPAIKERLYPVGRLDYATTGLLVMTNDGTLTQRLAHPSYRVTKVYSVRLDRPLEYDDVKAIKKGVRLNDGEVHVDSLSYVGKRRDMVRVTLHSGKYRVIRRLFARLGYHVEKLDRIRYAFLTKKNLPVGRWRLLTTHEIEELYNVKVDFKS